MQDLGFRRPHSRYSDGSTTLCVYIVSHHSGGDEGRLGHSGADEGDANSVARPRSAARPSSGGNDAPGLKGNTGSSNSSTTKDPGVQLHVRDTHSVMVLQGTKILP